MTNPAVPAIAGTPAVGGEHERWLPVPDYEGLYCVSSLGRVYSVPRLASSGRKVAGGLKAQRPNVGGRPVVNLNDATGRRKTLMVHRLVAVAFLGDPPAGHEVRHLNGNRQDNRLFNLAWGTKSENNQDTLRHGRHYWASRARCANGHELSGPNLSRDTKGARVCLACHRERQRRYEARKRRRLSGL